MVPTEKRRGRKPQCSLLSEMQCKRHLNRTPAIPKREKGGSFLVFPSGEKEYGKGAFRGQCYNINI
jgi:hypothetical protein